MTTHRVLFALASVSFCSAAFADEPPNRIGELLSGTIQKVKAPEGKPSGDANGKGSSATKPAGGLDAVVLRDVQGLWGGQDLWVRGDGRLVVQLVKGRGEKAARRFEAKLAEEDVARLAKVVAANRFFEIQVKDRMGVPDEARPKIAVRMADGRERTVAKWANDKHAEFDAVYRHLLGMCGVCAKGGKQTYEGAHDWKWQPPMAVKDEPASQPASDAASVRRVQDLVGKLGAADYKVREAATDELVGMGKAVRPMLEAKEKGLDPEVAGRIEIVLERLGGTKGPKKPSAGHPDDPTPYKGLGPNGQRE